MNVLKPFVLTFLTSLATISLYNQANAQTIGKLPEGMIEKSFTKNDSAVSGIKFTAAQADSLWAYVTRYPDIVATHPANEIPEVNVYGTDIEKVTIQTPKAMGASTPANTYVAADVIVEFKASAKELINTDAPWFLIQAYAAATNLTTNQLADLKGKYNARNDNQFGKRMFWETSYSGADGVGVDIGFPIFGKKTKAKNTSVFVVLGARVGGKEKTINEKVLEPVLVEENTLGNGWSTKHFDQTSLETFTRPAMYLGTRVRLSHDLLCDVGFNLNVTQDGTVTVRQQKNYDNNGTFVGNGPEDPNPRMSRSKPRYNVGGLRVGLSYETAWDVGPFKNVFFSAYVTAPNRKKLTNTFAGVGIGSTFANYRARVCKPRKAKRGN